MKGDSSNLKSHSIRSGCENSESDLLASPKSLGSTKALPFGETLRCAIKSAFRTSRSFAAALGVTEGRVSQLIGGAESITAATLEEVLAAFDDVGVQEALHAAWVRTYAPSPLTLTSSLEGEALAERLLARFSSVVASGNARSLLSSLRKAKSGVDEPELRFRIQRAVIDLALYLERPSLAIEGATLMLGEARNLASNGWIATALSSRASASRFDSKLPLAELIRMHEEFSGFMASWTPTVTEQGMYEELRQGAIRDRGLTLLAALTQGKVKKETLRAGTEPLNRLARQLREPKDRAIALEVLGRLLVAEGALFAAEDVLDEVRAIRDSVSYDHAPKTKLLRAQILIARREFDGANELLREAIEACWEIDDIHHALRGERLVLNLD